MLNTKNNLTLLAALVVWVLIPLRELRSEPTRTDNTFNPILPLHYPKPAIIPLLEESLRDPTIAKKKIKDDESLASLIKENKELRVNLKAAKSKVQVKLAVHLMENYAAIAYYYADRLSGKFGGGPIKKYQTLMLSSYRDLIENANVVQSLSKAPVEIAIASYHIYTGSYVIEDSAERNLEKLKGLTDKTTKLPDRLLKKAKFILAATELSQGNAKAADTIESVMDGIGIAGVISSKLALARFTAGLNGAGEKTGTTNPNYEKLLFAASDKAFSVGKRDQEAIFSFVLGVWRTAEGVKIPWKKPPLNEERFKNFPELIAIKERDALWEWFYGKKRLAINIYAQLAESLNAKPIASALDSRAIDMEELLYRESHNYATYEKILVNMRQRYSDEKNLGRDIDKSEKAVIATVEKRHRILVDAVLLAATAPQITEADRTNAIGLADRYLTTAKPKQYADVESIETKIANLWVLNKNYPKAVDLYLKLAKGAKADKKTMYYEQAIKSENILAKWPVDPPWDQVEAGSPAERKKLLEIYDSLNQLKKAKIDWLVVGHIGLLNLNLNQPAPAFKIWDDAIHKSPQVPAAAQAAGIMMTNYLKAQNWDNLENMARFTMLARIVPVFNKVPMNSAALLPLALLKGGDAAFKSGKFSVAIKKFKELIIKFSSKDDDYAYSMLASAYRGDEKHKESIEVLINFAEKFPKSTYLRQALINGGNWSVLLAYEENAMSFYKDFLKFFPADPLAVSTSESLAKLYMGRRLYAETVALYRDQAASAQITPQAKLSALAQLMKIEFKYGSKERADQAANTLLQANPTGDIRTEALVIKAYGYYSTRNVAGLQQLDAQLKGTAASATAQDSLSEIRYLLAESKLGPMFQSVNSNQVQDPIQAVFDRYNLFAKAEVDYLYVCGNSQPSMCGPALHRLARFAERMIQLIQDFQIPGTLEEKAISDFTNRRNGLIANLRKTLSNSDRRAAAIITSGLTEPEWTNQILWKNYSDWNFNQVSGHSGSGFVQWSLKK